MILARFGGSQDKCNEVVVCSGSDQKTTMESIVAAQFGLKNIHEMMQLSNISILKILSIIHAKARKVFLGPIPDSTFLKAIFTSKLFEQKKHTAQNFMNRNEFHLTDY